jgi:hypothetical protein
MNTNMNKQGYCQGNAVVGITEGTCQKMVAQIKQAKKNLVQEFGTRLAAHESVLRLALNEAEALAWETNYPHLVFATLAMEKAQAAATWEDRQQLLNPRNLGLAQKATVGAY